MTWFVVVLGLGLLVFLHELGHFSVARLVGMKPRAFYVGFGPALAKIQRNGIEYGIGALPLGGYVRLPGMRRPSADDFAARLSPALDEDRELRLAGHGVQYQLETGDLDAARAQLPALNEALERAQLSDAARRSAQQAVRDVEEGCASDAYWRQPTRKRVAVIAAGPAMNVLVAFLIFFAVYATGAPSKYPSTEVAQVQATSPAAAAGLRAGDRIVAVDGHRVRSFTAVSKLIGSSRGRAITVTVERSGRTIRLGPRRTIEKNGRWIWGFVPASKLVSYPIATSARLAIGDCWRVVTGTVTAYRDLARTGHGGQISGPVGVVRTSAQYLRVGLQWYLLLLGLISMSLAFFNLLPFLPLDGGNILISLVEGVRRRAVPQALYQTLSSVGIALMLVITLMALSNDLGAAPR